MKQDSIVGTAMTMIYARIASELFGIVMIERALSNGIYDGGVRNKKSKKALLYLAKSHTYHVVLLK